MAFPVIRLSRRGRQVHTGEEAPVDGYGNRRYRSGRVSPTGSSDGRRTMKIFDGYNVIGAAGSLGLSLEQVDKEERLLRLLNTYRLRKGGRGSFLVVFDGDYGRLAEGPKKYNRGGIAVEWAIGESADSVIIRRLRRSGDTRGIEVITSDEEILREVRHVRGRGTRSAAFVREAAALLREAPELEKPENISSEEVREWLTLFGGDEEDAPNSSGR
jgi:predicted RNA-binding protein with PIN domain